MQQLPIGEQVVYDGPTGHNPGLTPGQWVGEIIGYTKGKIAVRYPRAGGATRRFAPTNIRLATREELIAALRFKQ